MATKVLLSIFVRTWRLQSKFVMDMRITACRWSVCAAAKQ
jgi:hypothetical protein